MNSISQSGLIIQDRDRHLFRELAVMRAMDSEQAQIVGGFGSRSRANRRLRALTHAGLLRRFFLGTASAGRKAVYSLSEKGAFAVDVPYRGLRRRRDGIIATDYFVAHQLAVNAIHCNLKYRTIPVEDVSFHRWLPFFRPLADNLPLIPDGYLELMTPQEVVGHFLEVDLGNESGAVWRIKTENYLKLAVSGYAENLIGQSRFRVLVLANSERRMRSIRAVVAKTVEKIFWFSTLKAAEGDGFFAPVWLRPRGDNWGALIPRP
jgi:Replication-relaxation